MCQRASHSSSGQHMERNFRHSKRQTDRGGPPLVGGCVCVYEVRSKCKPGFLCDSMADGDIVQVALSLLGMLRCCWACIMYM